jgi:hypothetical protein
MQASQTLASKMQRLCAALKPFSLVLIALKKDVAMVIPAARQVAGPFSVLKMVRFNASMMKRTFVADAAKSTPAQGCPALCVVSTNVAVSSAMQIKMQPSALATIPLISVADARCRSTPLGYPASMT